MNPLLGQIGVQWQELVKEEDDRRESVVYYGYRIDTPKYCVSCGNTYREEAIYCPQDATKLIMLTIDSPTKMSPIGEVQLLGQAPYIERYRYNKYRHKSHWEKE